MGTMDRRAREALADYVPRGHQPGAATATPDRRVEQSANRNERAAQLAEQGTPGPEGTPPVITLTRPIGNYGWEPVSFLIPVGEVTEVLGRDPLRDTVDVTNQSSFLLGTACTVFLFRRKEDAETFAHMVTSSTLAQALASRPRCVVLPDAAGRQLQTTAPVFAIAIDTTATGATQAAIDCSGERRDHGRQ